MTSVPEGGDAPWIEEPPRVDGPISLVEYDPAWPVTFEAGAARIRSALGRTAALIEHAGSTAVPGLAAKPIIDIVLGVPNSTDEGAYVPPLEAVGYRLVIREPGWYEHRLLKGTDPAVNVHVFSIGCEEIEAMLRFRDRLRHHPGDLELYLRTKRQLAARTWTYVQDYADAKSEVIREIRERALSGG